MITFNHEAYIEDALRSVFSQRTDFPFELVIGDDASTDSTVRLIDSINPPGHIKVRKRVNASNLGMLRNFALTLSECRGEYVALLEGDDYWLDDNKLQSQIDFLDRHTAFAICYHPVMIRSGSTLADDAAIDNRDVTDIYDLANGNFMHTCSVVYRANLFESLPDSFFSSTVGDYFLHMLNARYGKIKKLPQIMGAYRVHSGGVWSMQPNMDIKILTYLEAMIGCFDKNIDDILKSRHQAIAFRSLRNRASEPGFGDRMLRCLKYGDEAVRTNLLSIFDTVSLMESSIFRHAFFALERAFSSFKRAIRNALRRTGT